MKGMKAPVEQGQTTSLYTYKAGLSNLLSTVKQDQN